MEGDHIWGGAVVDDAFREYEQAISTVGGFAGETEAFAETGELRKRENIEERDDQEIVELPEPALGEKPLARRVTKFAKGFAAHGRGETMTETRGKRIED